MAPPSRVRNHLLQRPLSMGIRLGRTAELHLPADVVSTREAELTVLAWLADFEGYMVADF